MTAKFTPRCGYLGCDPKGECLGFCDPALLHRVDASQLERGTVVHVGGNVEELPIDVAEPDKDRGPQMFTLAVMFGLFVFLLLALFAPFFWSAA